MSATVVVTARSFSSGSRDLEGALASAGFEVVRGPASHDLSELADPLADAVAWIAGTGLVSESHLAAAPELKIVARYGVGVDSVDLEAAAKRGVTVTNTPGANANAVAEFALGLLLAAARGIVAGDRALRAGMGERKALAREIVSSTIGIVGLGRIGSSFAAKVSALGGRVLGYDPYLPPTAFPSSVEAVELTELAEKCDAISLHAPGGRCLIDRDLLDRFRRSPVLVNTARADLVDEEAIAAALRDDRLSAYATDTLSSEKSLLLAPDLAGQVVITAHQAAHTVDAVDLMGEMAVENVLAVLAGHAPINAVSNDGGAR